MTRLFPLDNYAAPYTVACTWPATHVFDLIISRKKGQLKAF